MQYTGPILTQKEANASKSDYLFDLWYRSRAGADTVVRKTLDGWGELAGFANHAPESLANAKSKDILPTIIDNDKYYPERHALVLTTKTKIPKGIEIRFNYNAEQGFGGRSDSDMVRAMLSRGVTEQQLYSRAFLRLSTKRHLNATTRGRSRRISCIVSLGTCPRLDIHPIFNICTIELLASTQTLALYAEAVTLMRYSSLSDSTFMK